jgi:endonuclease/exonuclease/phosphatase family metal-dependent hydrolase
MTYNVEGLPWPLRIGRSEALDSISRRLLQMRAAGRQPHVVVLQEAFTADAKRVGRESGYRYVIDGPGRDDLNDTPPTRADTAFAASARFLNGERSGRILDSGLQILSDYPVLAVRRAPFPQYACAGFDCLANKGMLMALIAVPGSSTPVAVVTVHLNSHKASHAPYERADYAYRRQINAIDRFLTENVAPGLPLVVAGDFNVGKIEGRRTYLMRHASQWWNGRGGAHMSNAYDDCEIQQFACGRFLDADARYSFKHARDWQFMMPGRETALKVARIAVPFGHDNQGLMLSDHIGYVAYYHFAHAV